MKSLSIAITLTSMVLFACGGSGGSVTEGGGTGSLKSDSIGQLANTYWEKECSAYNNLSSGESDTLWNVKIKLRIDFSLNSTYRTEFYHPNDIECDSMMFDALDISEFKFSGKVMSEESIEAYALNETFIFNSNNRDLPPSYTLLYIDSEKLYFGQKSGVNLGETPQTRRSSISLDNSFTQIVN